MISAVHLTKRYGPHVAVDDISFHVGKGEIVGFLGPNGAGKSTTLRILSGYLAMTSGRVTIAGHDIATDSFEARKNIGYMPESVPLYPEMRVVEYLAFRAELKKVARKDRRVFVDEAMQKANVVDVAMQRIGTLSKGYRQRVGLADALLAKPGLLILDEPTAGLDPNQIREVRAVIKGLGAEHTVLLSTHALSEVEASCSRVLLIHKGELVAGGDTLRMDPRERAPRTEIVLRASAEAAARALDGVANDVGISVQTRDADGVEPSVVVTLAWSETLSAGDVAQRTEAAVAAFVAAGLGVREVRPAGRSLEELFAALTLTRDARDSNQPTGDA